MQQGTGFSIYEAHKLPRCVNPDSGLIIERNHDLKGKNVEGRILCFPHGQGSTVGSYVLYLLAKKGLGPKAIINQTADPVVVAGAIIAKIPMMDQINIQQIKTDDNIEVDIKLRKRARIHRD